MSGGSTKGTRIVAVRVGAYVPRVPAYMNQTLNDTERLAVLGRSFIVDCPRMTLQPMEQERMRSEEIEFDGAGQIAFNEKGHFDVRLYLRRQVEPDWYNRMLRVRPGAIIGDRYKYGLLATDWQGRTWTAAGLLPSPNSGAGGAVVRAASPQIETTSEGVAIEGSALRVVLAEDIQFPANTYVTTERKIEADFAGSSMQLSMARFSASAFHCQLEHESGCAVLSASSRSETFSTDEITALLDALAFVTADDCRPAIVDTQTGSRSRTRITATAASNRRGWARPPLEIQSHQPSFWALYGAVLEYELRAAEQGLSRLGPSIRSVLLASRTDLDVMALNLCVAIDSMVVQSLGASCSASVPSREQLAATKQLIRNTPGFDPALRARLEGAVSAMGAVRAKDVLIELRNRRLLRPKLVESYESLRNHAAHGVRLDAGDLQAYLDRCFDVITLYHELIFLRVGYTGEYSDYSVAHWPVRPFRGSLSG